MSLCLRVTLKISWFNTCTVLSEQCLAESNWSFILCLMMQKSRTLSQNFFFLNLLSKSKAIFKNPSGVKYKPFLICMLECKSCSLSVHARGPWMSFQSSHHDSCARVFTHVVSLVKITATTTKLSFPIAKVMHLHGDTLENTD